MRKIYASLLVMLMAIVPAMAQTDYTVSLPEGTVLNVGDKADFITETTGGSDNANWYLMTQVRVQSGTATATPMYDNGTSTLCRADVSVTPNSLKGTDPTENAKYLVRFFKTTDGAYNVQFATGNFIQTTLVTGAQESAGKYLIYNINNTATHIGWNLTSDGTTYGDIVDNNGAGYTLSFWDSGQVSSLDGNNDWSVYPVSFVGASDVIVATVHYSYVFNGTEVYSYETQTKGGAPLTVSFDAPGTYLGATCADATPADQVVNESKTINVTYTYTLDNSSLPFVPTTVADGAFAAGTKWYYLCPQKKTVYSYYDATLNQNNGGLDFETQNSAPAKGKYMFAFTGDPFNGYSIYNCEAGAGAVAYAAPYTSKPNNLYFGTGEAAKFELKSGYSSNDQYRFHYMPYTDGNAYLDAYEHPQYLYSQSEASGWAWYPETDDAAQYYITEVPADIVELVTGGQISVTSITPEGNVNGSISEINIVFDAPIYRVYGLDHEGAGMEGEDEPKVITWTDASGNVTEFTFEGDGNGYAVNEENPNQLDIYFERPLTAIGKYTLTVPANTVFNEQGKPNAEIGVSYNLKDAFEPVTVTARVYNAAFGDFTGDVWTQLPYDETLGYYTIPVQVNAKDEVIFKNHTGVEGEDVKVTFDPATGQIQQVDDTDPDSYSSWLVTSTVLDGVYGDYYLYQSNSYCNIDFNTEDGVGHGTAALYAWGWDTWTYKYQFIEWYIDNRFADDTELIEMISSTPAEGATVDNVSTISLTFAQELTEIAAEKTLTLTNDAGATCGGTLTYALNEGDKKTIDVTLSEPLTADGTYTLTIPTGLGAREAETNAGYTESATLTFKIGTGSAASWTAKAIDYIPSDCTNPLFSEGGKFDNITVNCYESTHTYVVDGFMGNADNDLTIVTDENGSVLTINAQKEDSYGSMSVYTGNNDYYFAYIYPDYCQFNFNKDGGYMQLAGYYYKDSSDEEGTWATYSISWDGATGLNTVIAPELGANKGIYSLAGQKMNAKNLKGGIYIKDGKKVVIK